MRALPVRTRAGWTRAVVERIDGADVDVVFLHGLGARADRWEGTLAALGLLGANGIAVDLPGHGFADRDPAHRFDMTSMTGFVVDVLDALAVERAVVVGASFGGMIAAHVARTAPDRIEALLLVAPLGCAPLPDTVADTLAASTRGASRDRAEAKLRRLLVDAEITAAMIDEEYGFVARAVDGDALAGLRERLEPPRPIDDEPIVPWLADVAASMPVTVLRGDLDTVVDPAALDAAVGSLPGVRLVPVADAGHQPYTDRPEMFVDVLDGLVREVRVRRTRDVRAR
jgi:2-hydroxy-6-oxonona-2,4-dienedioate hydrolase